MVNAEQQQAIDAQLSKTLKQDFRWADKYIKITSTSPWKKMKKNLEKSIKRGE